MEESIKRVSRILAKTPKLRDEILQAAATGRLPILQKLGISRDTFEAVLTGRRGRNAGLEGMGFSGRSEMPHGSLEAIVRVVGRPPLLVKNGTYEKPPTESLRKQLEPHRKRINKVVESVGRVEFRFHRMPWGGTGWMIDKNIVVTNRHVAELVAESDRRGGFRYKSSAIGRPFEA